MNRFAYAKATTWEEAQTLLSDRRFSLPVLKGGGLDLLDQMKEGLIEPDLLIDIRAGGAADDPPPPPLEDGQPTPRPPTIWLRGNPDRRELEIRYDVTLARLAEHPDIRGHAPALAQAAESAATPQVRNVATIAGNLLQRPRCWYFRHDEFNCLKKGGPTCFAVDGENQYHAIFGGGPCHIVHPSNIACALNALGCLITGIGVEEPISIDNLYHLPDAGVRTEHNLPDRAVIYRIRANTAPRSAFYAIKHKQSFDWPIVMAAAALTIENDRIASARICAGAVAPIPWPLPRVADALAGVAIDDDAAISRACALSTEGARPMSQNAYKVRLLPVAVNRAVLRALGRLPEELL
jgi:xanthine dehydrogenase YagS FAD-binding subunit